MRNTAVQQARILIIDDEVHVVAFLRRMLEEEGYRKIQSTSDSRTAVDLFVEFQPDLVVLDWRMPAPSGREILAKLRTTLPMDAQPPVLVVTADPTIETRREALNHGASDVVAKPYDRVEIVARIGNLLATRFVARQRAEDAMREGELRFFDTFEHAPIGVALVSPDGRWLKVNRALCDLVGYSEAELLVRTFQDITHPEDLLEDLENFHRTIAGTIRSYQMEKRYIHACGHTVTVMLNVTLVRDGLAQPRYFIAQIQDITERKETQLEIERLNADLEERVAQRTEDLFIVTQEAELANRAKSEFLSRTSHELRTPMNAILGFGQLLEMEDNLRPDVRESIAQILDAGRHLLALIDDILDISNAESGAMTVELEPVSVEQAIAETMKRVRPLGTAFGIQLELRLPEDRHWRVLASAQRLKQVLQNLLSNAIQYNLPGGKVILEGVPAKAADSAVFRFSVKDTGPGIEAEDLPRLFTPFDRLDTRRHVTGSGLGLAVSKRIVELMGGRIGVESTVGHGSTFWIELRLADCRVAPIDETAFAIISSANHRLPASETFKLETTKTQTVLYIEDNLSNLRLLTRILDRRPAVQLSTAPTGLLGLQMARDLLPDLILLDLRLSDMNGQQVLASLQSDPRTREIPVVILTADGMPGKREQMLAAGARAFLTKPVEVRALLGVLDLFLDGQPAAADEMKPFPRTDSTTKP